MTQHNCLVVAYDKVPPLAIVISSASTSSLPPLSGFPIDSQLSRFPILRLSSFVLQEADVQRLVFELPIHPPPPSTHINLSFSHSSPSEIHSISSLRPVNMPKLAALYIFAFYILFLTLLTPTAAVVERGFAYVDNYDDSLAAELKARGVEAEDYEWHKRANGKGVIQVRAEKVAEAAAAVEERDQHATGGHFSGEDHNDGTDWNKRGDIHATSEGPDDGHDWLKRAPQWLNKLLKRDFIWNGPEEIGPGPTKVKSRGGIDGGAPPEGDGPNKSHDWLMKRGVWPWRGWSPKLDKREFEGNSPKPEGPDDIGPGPTKLKLREEGGPDDSHDWLKREEAVSKPNDSHDWLMKRSSIGPSHKSKPFPSPGRKLKLDKRGMIEEWMHPRAMEKRQFTCENPGYVPCSNSPYCCPSQSNCCPSGCKKDPSDVCCNGYSCDAGYQCMSTFLPILLSQHPRTSHLIFHSEADEQ